MTNFIHEKSSGHFVVAMKACFVGGVVESVLMLVSGCTVS
jgi:hypothetical protein